MSSDERLDENGVDLRDYKRYLKLNQIWYKTQAPARYSTNFVSK